jgi:hypothetical protein
VASNTLFAAQTPNKNTHMVGSCGFIDTINFVWPTGSNILSIKSSGGLDYKEVTTTQYYIEDNGSCDAGVVTVKVGADAAHASTVQITDGPWEYINATQTTSVGNYNFTGETTTGLDVYSFNYAQQ